MRISFFLSAFSLSLCLSLFLTLPTLAADSWEFSGNGITPDCTNDGQTYTHVSQLEPTFFPATFNGCSVIGASAPGDENQYFFFPGTEVKKFVTASQPSPSSEWTMAPEMWAFFYGSLKFVAMHWVLLTITRWL